MLITHGTLILRQLLNMPIIAMPKKRRKLSRDLESEISKASKKVELITAKINDIKEEEILTDYRLAFEPVRNTFLLLSTLYISEGFTNQTQDLLKIYKELLKEFEEEFEI